MALTLSQKKKAMERVLLRLITAHELPSDNDEQRVFKQAQIFYALEAARNVYYNTKSKVDVQKALLEAHKHVAKYT